MIYIYSSEKGFCLLGDLCSYDHGVDPVVVDDVNYHNLSMYILFAHLSCTLPIYITKNLIKLFLYL